MINKGLNQKLYLRIVCKTVKTIVIDLRSRRKSSQFIQITPIGPEKIIEYDISISNSHVCVCVFLVFPSLPSLYLPPFFSSLSMLRVDFIRSDSPLTRLFLTLHLNITCRYVCIYRLMHRYARASGCQEINATLTITL